MTLICSLVRLIQMAIIAMPIVLVAGIIATKAPVLFLRGDDTFLPLYVRILDLLVLGDSIYTSSGDYFYVALGIIGCLPITVNDPVPTDVTTCAGDSSGSVVVSASGGFGAPWQYSIDNGLTYQESPLFQNVPAGDYNVVVIDAENCAQAGPALRSTSRIH